MRLSHNSFKSLLLCCVHKALLNCVTTTQRVAHDLIAKNLLRSVNYEITEQAGYVGLDGSLDLSILIRTIAAGRGWWQLPVGGGIVAQSSPRREYEETWHKALGMIEALR